MHSTSARGRNIASMHADAAAANGSARRTRAAIGTPSPAPVGPRSCGGCSPAAEIQSQSILPASCTSSCLMLMIRSSLAQNRSPSLVVLRLLRSHRCPPPMRRRNHNSRLKGIPKNQFASFRGFQPPKACNLKNAQSAKIETSGVFRGQRFTFVPERCIPTRRADTLDVAGAKYAIRRHSSDVTACASAITRHPSRRNSSNGSGSPAASGSSS